MCKDRAQEILAALRNAGIECWGMPDAGGVQWLVVLANKDRDPLAAFYEGRVVWPEEEDE